MQTCEVPWWRIVMAPLLQGWLWLGLQHFLYHGLSLSVVRLNSWVKQEQFLCKMLFSLTPYKIKTKRQREQEERAETNKIHQLKTAYIHTWRIKSMVTWIHMGFTRGDKCSQRNIQLWEWSWFGTFCLLVILGWFGFFSQKKKWERI